MTAVICRCPMPHIDAAGAPSSVDSLVACDPRATLWPPRCGEVDTRIREMDGRTG